MIIGGDASAQDVVGGASAQDVVKEREVFIINSYFTIQIFMRI